MRRAARYKQWPDGRMERVIMVVSDIGECPEGWFPSELEAAEAAAQPLASPAPSPTLMGAPAASRPKRGRPKKIDV